MAIAQQQRINEDVSVAKRNLFCEVQLPQSSGCYQYILAAAKLLQGCMLGCMLFLVFTSQKLRMY